MKDKHPLLEIKWGVPPIIAYRGCLVARLPNEKYFIWGNEFEKPEQVDAIIDKASEWLGKSVKS